MEDSNATISCHGYFPWFSLWQIVGVLSLSKFRNNETKIPCRGYQIRADVSYFRTAARSIAFVACAKPMWQYSLEQ